jgi:hypothetical protein
MLGVHEAEAARAFPYNFVLREKLLQHRIGSKPIICGCPGKAVPFGFLSRESRVLQVHLSSIAFIEQILPPPQWMPRLGANEF